MLLPSFSIYDSTVAHCLNRFISIDFIITTLLKLQMLSTFYDSLATYFNSIILQQTICDLANQLWKLFPKFIYIYIQNDIIARGVIASLGTN